ncbi:hypothetical protein ARMGADRAFT_1089776 [Armillaria gallica]|uniref:Uncharacterized protein n=1 Tax=Armillaria gallica TaxID=47427 RepID=A0A2H3CNS2_ARMGA|nr:hypothetical protein ARMGADRAFT_1089776 [Armillaria gallica]
MLLCDRIYRPLAKLPPKSTPKVTSLPGRHVPETNRSSSRTSVKTISTASNIQNPLPCIVIPPPAPPFKPPIPTPPSPDSDTSSDSSIMSPSSSQHIVPGMLKGPVHFTEGEVTLALIEDYMESTRIYVCEHHDKSAYSLKQESYDVMTLNGFLNAMHSFFFMSEWAMDQAQKVKSMKQDGSPSKTWFVNVFSMCRILAGLPEEIKDAELMGFLLVTMDHSLYSALKPEAHSLANLIKSDTADATKGEMFAKWCELVNATDKELRKNDK